MSKEIDLTKQLSEFDLRYLVDRNRWDDIRTNADNLGLPVPNLPSARGLRAQVPRSQLRNTDAFDKIAKQLKVSIADTEEQEASEESKTVDYSKLTVPQLKEELEKRRADYEASGDSDAVADVSYSNEDRKDDLVAKLQLDDEASSEDEE